MLEEIEKTRLRVSGETAAGHKSQFGQFLTPAATARFMARRFRAMGVAERSQACRLLDAGAGIGSLSNAFLERCETGELRFDSIALTSYEIDAALHPELRAMLARPVSRLDLRHELCSDDFIEAATNQIQFGRNPRYTHAILNPPYRKISGTSRHRLLLKNVGLETVNLYAAFVALSIRLMAAGGQIVAIVPRSFCNGPYYKPFREMLLATCAIRSIHLFASRATAFKDDQVLQENVIIHLEVGATQAQVEVTTSTDDRFDDLVSLRYPFDRLVIAGDPQKFIHIPTPVQEVGIDQIANFSLADIGVQVSTGPVVDFRLKPWLRTMPEAGTVPLLYPAHFSVPGIAWPRPGIKKPNAILRNAETEKWLYPNGHYCVVRRFSSKEERHRIHACVVNPDIFGATEKLGFENHLNVFHEDRHGLPENLARGLTVYLKSSMVDHHFRQFSGHTQVNATDLKLMRYPSRGMLMHIGAPENDPGPTQGLIDTAVMRACKT